MTQTSTPDLMADIADFHHKFEISYHGRPRALPPELGFFRTKFMQEELDEYKTHRDELLDIFGNERATSKIDEERITKLLEEQLDAIVDLVYVALGTAYLHGFEYNRFYEAWRRVHKKNMEKIRVASAEESKRGSAFDVVKPAGWTPPRHTDLVEDHVHRAL